MKIGIVGLPNVGKSTLFNAFLRRQQALSANYPFATIEPNVGVVDVYDKRVDKLAEISHPIKKIYANITFVDIAGIVEGAHRGEGLGNQFLANIREVDLILVLLRDFTDKNVVIKGSTNPKNDYDIILTELILKDLETIQKQEKHLKNAGTDKDERDFKTGVEKTLKILESGNLANKADLSEDEFQELQSLHLLTQKPLIKLLNVDEKSLSKRFNEYKAEVGPRAISKFNRNHRESSTLLEVGPRAARLFPEASLVTSAKIESELASLNTDDQKAYMKTLGLAESPLNEVIKVCYKVLNLKTFLTTGPKESRAWKFKNGMNAKECAGVIHSDFEKNFIKAEVITYSDFVLLGGKLQAKDAGKIRIEGKDYLMQDGDVVEFKIGA